MAYFGSLTSFGIVTEILKQTWYSLDVLSRVLLDHSLLQISDNQTVLKALGVFTVFPFDLIISFFFALSWSFPGDSFHRGMSITHLCFLSIVNLFQFWSNETIRKYFEDQSVVATLMHSSFFQFVPWGSTWKCATKTKINRFNLRSSGCQCVFSSS